MAHSHFSQEGMRVCPALSSLVKVGLQLIDSVPLGYALIQYPAYS